MQVHVVANTNAREWRRSPGLLDGLLSARGAPEAELHSTSTLHELESAIERIANASPSVVVLVGGDGTHMASVSAMARVFGDRLPPVSLVAAGTVGTVAANWGGTPFNRRHLAELFDALFRGHAARTVRPTLRVRDDAGGARVGFIFGTGLVTNFFRLYDASAERGEFAAAKIVARGFASSLFGGDYARKLLDPVRATISVGGEEQAGASWSLLVASVVPNLGLGMRLTYRAAEQLERFHVVASGLSTSRLGPQLPRVVAGVQLRGEGNVDKLTDRLDLAFASGGSYILDGDSFLASRVVVSSGPRLEVLSAP